MSQSVPVLVNSVKVLSHSLSGSYYWHGLIRSKPVSDRSKENLKDNKVKGRMSLKTSTLLKNTLSNWISAIYAKMESRGEKEYNLYKYLTFVTLTLPREQIHTDYFIKRHLLGNFFKKLVRHTKRKDWLYCCEAQKNGNIHFHIAIDGMLYWACVRAIWNDCLNLHGYIDRFEKKHGHRDPNSTDIHSFRGIANAGKYMAKYMTKDNNAQLIEGRLWGCTDNLRKLTPYRDDMHSDIDKIVKDGIKDCKSRFYKSDFYYVLESSSIFAKLRAVPALYKCVLAHYVCQFDSLKKGVWQKGDTSPKVVATCQTKLIEKCTLPKQGTLPFMVCPSHAG